MIDSDPIDRISAAIMDYLAIRPQAADSLEGIHHWWINWAGQEAPLEMTQLALESLAAKGQLQVRLLAGREIWSRAPAKQG
ncbi:hypothetical protein [Gallaecimonas pentaromativorans]|uniref:DUF3253 domain-containing protein n=1 Tax=Gallaecimonas pentaromativorans TaxID=584787 RepID=A0A3N1PUY0_9GAMM|nr:hypothetical protein [Gallaecimonas pentaromativorans]MED5523357.1 hypothetical protein [Pseudomonadota bacterium]ROQ30550.1 hypothetical protein EDC28_101236 [Gallaecimonas pentaromativorans]